MDMRQYWKLVAFVVFMSLLFTASFANLFSDLPAAKRSNILFIRKADAYPLSAEVVNLSEKFKMGIVMDPDRIDFGKVSESGQVRKRLVLLNPSPYTAKAKFFVFGNISDYIHVGSWDGEWDEKWSMIIPPNSTVSVEIGFEAGNVGNYSGTLYVVTFMPRTELGWLMEVV